MRVAFATCDFFPDGWDDDRATAQLLGAEFRSWSDPSVAWEQYDRVVLRSVFDYPGRLNAFLAWSRRVGDERLRNTPSFVGFNADKRYLSELRAPTVPTTFVAAGEPLPMLAGEVVVKPAVSAGARDTGRFSPSTHDRALALIERIRSRGGTAIVQPYLPAVEDGETSLVYLGGTLSHILRKGPVLDADEVAPVATDGVGAQLGIAQAMLNEQLVQAGRASPAEQAVGAAVVAELSERFGTPVFLRIDLLRDASGPLVLEVEGLDAALYLDTAPGAPEAFAAAVLAS